jgi:predicted hydrocarbon binding protein
MSQLASPLSATHTSPLISAAPATLLALRAALLTRPDLDTVFALRDAGYAGGDALYDAFETYVRDQELIGAQELDSERFFRRAGEFLTRCGWGDVSVSAKDDTFCAVDIERCWEAAVEHQPDPRGCHLTVGLLGAFLGKFADYPMAVLEIGGPETGSARASFIAGNTEMIAEYYAQNS